MNLFTFKSQGPITLLWVVVSVWVRSSNPLHCLSDLYWVCTIQAPPESLVVASYQSVCYDDWDYNHASKSWEEPRISFFMSELSWNPSFVWSSRYFLVSWSSLFQLQKDRENKTNPAKATDWSRIVDCRESSLFSEFGFLWVLTVAPATTTGHLLESRECERTDKNKRWKEGSWISVCTLVSTSRFQAPFWSRKSGKLVATAKIFPVFFHSALLPLRFWSSKMLLDALYSHGEKWQRVLLPSYPELDFSNHFWWYTSFLSLWPLWFCIFCVP